MGFYLNLPLPSELGPILQGHNWGNIQLVVLEYLFDVLEYSDQFKREAVKGVGHSDPLQIPPHPP